MDPPEDKRSWGIGGRENHGELRRHTATPSTKGQGVLASTSPNTEASLRPVSTCLAPVSWFSRASMDEEASLGTAWWKERWWKSEQAGSPCSGWAYWSGHILGEARAPAIQDTPAPQLLTHQVHPPPRPQTVLTGPHRSSGCFVWMVRHFG